MINHLGKNLPPIPPSPTRVVVLPTVCGAQVTKTYPVDDDNGNKDDVGVVEYETSSASTVPGPSVRGVAGLV